MHRTVLAAAAAVGLSISGCARVQYLTRPVLLPTVAAPVLTPVKSSDVQCLSGATYTALVNRERATWDWGAAQQAIIKANNAKAEVK